METLESRDPTNGEEGSGREPSDGSGPPAPSSRGGKLGRIAGHTRGLVDDLREWIDLRLDLAILEIEEQVDDLRNELALGLTLAILGFFAALFVLTTIALGLGWLLGHPFWGFLIVAGALSAVAAALAQSRPDLLPSSNLYDRLRGGADEAGPSADSGAPAREAPGADSAE